jgi:formylglycine-generating enzyme required for sulfatase activity
MENDMARIFVSYSRKNKDFCRQLTDELQKRDIDFWVDWNDIDPTVKWKDAIGNGIEDADNFLAIVTPDWILSPICLEELNIAVMNGKRLIPVVPCEITWNDVPAALADLNFIFFTEAYDFNQQFDTLLTALNTDYEWVNSHTRLQAKALEWERNDKENGFLLHRKELEDAEAQISINANKDPHPTDLQREYVLKSRQAATRQRRIATSVLAFIIVMLAGITAYLGVPRVLDLLAQSWAQGEMVLISEGPSIFGTEDPLAIDFGFTVRQSIESLPAFQIDKYEVSNYQYGLCVKYGDCTVPVVPTNFEDETIHDLPVVNVTLFQANTYCRWLGERLPNQFEWERAARGPELYEWPWGNDQEPTPDMANMPWKDYVPTSLQSIYSNPAGKSPEGIYNLIGNAAEWTSSLFVAGLTYDTGQVWDGNPESFDGTQSYSIRGGGWREGVDEVGTDIPDRGLSAGNDVGFRCAANAK